MAKIQTRDVGFVYKFSQYSKISQGAAPFTPTFDADGNQTLIKTTTGIWSVAYNADKRPTSFSQAQGYQSTIIECGYDYIGRRYTKKVTINGTVSLHQRYIYRGYLQIACVDLTRSEHPALWYITWDPTEPVATRPLAIQKNATWYTYSHDLTKNVTELYQSDGLIATSYDYSPYGAATAEGIDQALQWSSEYHDPELALTYYNYRHYNPTDGRWINQDPLGEGETLNLYRFVKNNHLFWFDYLGLAHIITDMTNGFTYWIPTNCCCEAPKKYKSLSKVVKGAKPGANDPYHSDVSMPSDIHPDPWLSRKRPVKSFGPHPVILTDDLNRGRWIHGGGTDPNQPLRPTEGCTRMHNQDVKELGDLLRAELTRHPKSKVPYDRAKFKKGSEPLEYTQCVKTYNSEKCKKGRAQTNKQ